MKFSSQTCNKMISKIVIRYRDYYTVFLGRNKTTNEVGKQGKFYQYITNAVPRCCPNLPVEFVFENATEQDTIELVMTNLTNSSKRPRPFVFYFPEFMGQHIKRVYDFQLFYIKLSSSSGQAVVMYSPDESARRKMTANTIVKSSVLLLILMLALSWLFGILGWAAVSFFNFYKCCNLAI